MNDVPKGCRDQLAARGLALEDLATHVRPLGDDECLLLVGSVAEGLANRESDVDLLLIGAHQRFTPFQITRPQFEVETVHLSPTAEVSVEVCEPAQLLRVKPTMAAATEVLEYAGPLERLPLIGVLDATILHRLRTGIPLINPEVVERWREELRLDVLPEVFALSLTLAHFARREDGLSHAEEGDFDLATLCLRDAAADAAGMLMAGLGVTHPSPRWQLRLLQVHASDLGEARVAALTSAILDRISDLAGVERVLTLFDEVVFEAAVRLPRAATVGAELAAHFPLRSHVGDDGQLDGLLNEVSAVGRRHRPEA